MSQGVGTEQNATSNPGRVSLRVEHGVPSQPYESAGKGSGGFGLVFLLSVLCLGIGAAGGWFGFQAIDNEGEYQRYAAELEPLLYYKDRVHSAKVRGSNETMRLVNYKVYQAHMDGLNIEKLLDLAQPRSLQPPPLTRLNRARFVSNLKLGIEYGIYEGKENLKALAYGKAPTITKGPHKGERIDVEHVVPKAIAPDLDNILANLMWLPAPLNQSKSDTITDEALKMAEVFADLKILPHEQLAAVKSAYQTDSNR